MLSSSVVTSFREVCDPLLEDFVEALLLVCGTPTFTVETSVREALDPILEVLVEARLLLCGMVRLAMAGAASFRELADSLSNASTFGSLSVVSATVTFSLAGITGSLALLAWALNLAMEALILARVIDPAENM